MKFVIQFTDGHAKLVDVDDYIEVRRDADRVYVDADGTLYGNSGPHDVERVGVGRNERPIDP